MVNPVLRGTMNTRTIQTILVIPGIIGLFFIGFLLSKISLVLAIVCCSIFVVVFLYSVKRYPKNEVLALFGILFGFLLLPALAGSFFLISAGKTVSAIVWPILWLIAWILLQKPIRKKVTPTFYFADEFAAIVGPIPISRGIPGGCFIFVLECILFFLLLMTAGLLGPVLWGFHLILLWIFSKRHRGKTLIWKNVLLFIIVNIVLLFLLKIVLDNLGVEPFLRRIMGG